MTDISTEVYAVRAEMVDGASIDLLLFNERADAEKHAQYVSDTCPLFGYDNLTVVKRRVIGPQETINRRQRYVEVSRRRRRGDAAARLQRRG